MIKTITSCFFLIVTSLSVGSPLAQLAGPINACTIYKPGFRNYFDQCAGFKVKRGHGCKKKKCVGAACYEYNGDKVSMYLPDFFIEVTPHYGRSIFAEDGVLGKSLKLHLEAGMRYWDSVKAPGAWVPSLTGATKKNQAMQSGGQIDDGMQIYHVRIISIPGASAVTLYPSNAYPRFKSKSGGIPVCFEAISEMIPSQWRDNRFDGIFAMATAGISFPLCNSTNREVIGAGAMVQGAIREVRNVIGLLDGSVLSGLSGMCSYPAPSFLVKGKLLSPNGEYTKAITNPLNLCIGSFGEKFPRSNAILASDEHSAAVIAAVRFSSLASDVYSMGGYRIATESDKIQQVYPKPTSPSCFRPGDYSEALAMNAEPLAALLAMKRENAPTGLSNPSFTLNEKLKGTYVFAVWKKRTSCEEPMGNGFWKSMYKTQKKINKGLCNL